jgi:hypothetical protein
VRHAHHEREHRIALVRQSMENTGEQLAGETADI